MYENTNDCCFYIIMDTKCMSGKWLSCLEFSFTDGDTVVVLIADRIIFTLIGEVEIKKVMPVEKFLVSAALMDTD